MDHTETKDRNLDRKFCRLHCFPLITSRFVVHDRLEHLNLDTLSLFRLPTELIVKAFSYLGAPDIISASIVSGDASIKVQPDDISQTCRHVYQIVKESINVQYQIELFAAGLVDDRIPFTDVPAFSRLEKVKDYQERWRTLDWRRSETYSLPESCPLLDLYGGAFAQMWYIQAEDDDNPHSCLNVFYPSSASRGRDTFTKVSYGDLGLGYVREFVIDPDQELLVIVGQAIRRRK